MTASCCWMIEPIRPVQIIKILPCRPVLNPESLPRTHRPDKRSRQSASIRTGIETYGKPAFESRIERNIIRSSPHKSPTYMFSGTDSPRVRLERTVSKTGCRIVVLDASDRCGAARSDFNCFYIRLRFRRPFPFEAGHDGLPSRLNWRFSAEVKYVGFNPDDSGLSGQSSSETKRRTSNESAFVSPHLHGRVRSRRYRLMPPPDIPRASP